MQKSIKPEAFERHRHPPLIEVLEILSLPVAMFIVGAVLFHTAFARSFVPASATTD